MQMLPDLCFADALSSTWDLRAASTPRLGGFGLLFLPGKLATLERKQVSAMLPTLRKCSDGRPASRGPSELFWSVVCSVREPANVLCSQFRVTGSIQRGVAFLGGVADLRTCAAPETFHIWPYRQYHPFRFRPWNASDQSIPPILSLLRRVPILGCLRSLGRDSK